MFIMTSSWIAANSTSVESTLTAQTVSTKATEIMHLSHDEDHAWSNNRQLSTTRDNAVDEDADVHQHPQQPASAPEHNHLHQPYAGCREIFVGAGWGGVYSFYRRVLDGVQRNNRSGSRYCLMEQSSRIGGRTYSVPVSHRHTGGRGERFVVDVGAYRFTPDMHLVSDLILHHLALPTKCYDPTCPSPQSDFPEVVMFNYTSPFRRIIDPKTGLPNGFDTALHQMVETCQRLGARVFLETKLVQIHVPTQHGAGEHANQEQDSSSSSENLFRLVFENTETGIRSAVRYHGGHNMTDDDEDDEAAAVGEGDYDDDDSIQVLILNLPRNHLLQVEGLRDALDPDVVKTLECIVFDAPEDLFGKEAVRHMQENQNYITTIGKAYLFYEDAWWQTKLNKTQGEWPPNVPPSISATPTPQGVLLRIRWHDGPVQCDQDLTHPEVQAARPSLEIHEPQTQMRPSLEIKDNHEMRNLASSAPTTCRGFLEVYYSVSNETFYSSLPAETDLDHEDSYPSQVQDPLGMLWLADAPHARSELGLAHAALMQSLQPLWNQTPELWQASLAVQPPLGMVVGIWQRPNRYHPLGDGWTDPSKVFYDPTMSGTPERACGGVPGLTDESYRHTVLQPFHGKPSLYDAATVALDLRNTSNISSSLTTPARLPRIFLVNNDFVCSHVRYAFGDWAEESLMQAERAMYLLGTPKPEWLNETYYQQHVVQYAQLPNHTWKTTAIEPVPGMEPGPMVALILIVAAALILFILELWRRFPASSYRDTPLQLLKWNSEPDRIEAGQDPSSKHSRREAGGGDGLIYFGDIDQAELRRGDENGESIFLTSTKAEDEPSHDDDKYPIHDNGNVDDENYVDKELEEARKAALNLWSWQNLAIPVSYWVGGTCAGMFRTFLNVYPLDIGANEAQQTTCATLAALPAAFKILYGFTSDTNPIFGLRRKPYLFLGWFLASMIMLSLCTSSDLTLQRERLIEDREDGVQRKRDLVIVPPGAPSLLQLSMSFFVFGFGMWFANAMTDALVAEKAKFEPDAVRGTLQSTCYLMRFFGLMVSAPISTYLYSKVGPQILVKCLVGLPSLVLPLLYFLAEPRVVVKPVREQCKEIWQTVCSRAVWEPMAFMYLFNLLQVSNAAWRQFLVTVLGFTPANLNTLLVVSYVLVYLGTMLYKYCLLHTSWRLIYQGCLILNLFLSSMQLLLIRGHTFGISPFLFALGDDAFAEFLNGIQFLPAVIMMVSLCPSGSEGVSYATFTTVMNSSWMISNSISSLMLGIWDVSKESMEQGKLDGMFNLSLLTSIIQFSPLFFLSWLPHGRKELEELATLPYSGSAIGGRIFLSVLFGSMSLTLLVSLLNILKPGWAGGS